MGGGYSGLKTVVVDCDIHAITFSLFLSSQLEAKSGLLNHGIQLEEFGGEVVGVEISALQVFLGTWLLCLLSVKYLSFYFHFHFPREFTPR